MFNERLYKKIGKWSNGVLVGLGFATVLGVGYGHFHGAFDNSTQHHLVRRGADSAPSIMHIETGFIIDNTNKEEKLFMESLKLEKTFVKYQYPSEKFVPIDELATVFLNGMKFYHQGSEMLPANDTVQIQMISNTRASNTLQCEGRTEYKAYKQTHSTTTKKQTTTTSTTTTTTTEPTTKIAEDAQLETFQSGGNLGKVDNDISSEDIVDPANLSPNFDANAARSLDVDNDAMSWMLSLFDDTTTDAPTTPALTIKKEMDTSMSTDQSSHKIGCCNGVPYNQSKRCCCRRISFDKDKKFCCAINGCEKFKIFDRSNPKNVDLCQSLKGLVVQEYGYTGENAHLGEPDLTKNPRMSRPY